MPLQRNHRAVWERRKRSYAAWCAGETEVSIAEREGVNQSQISRDIVAVLTHLVPAEPDDTKKNLLLMLGKLAQQEAELLAAWERSKKTRQRDKAKTRRKPGRKADADPGKWPVVQSDSERVTEPRDGNPRFQDSLTRVRELMARLLKLLVSTHEHSGPGGGPIQHEHTITPERRRTELLGIVAAIRNRIRNNQNPGTTHGTDGADALGAIAGTTDGGVLQ